MIHHSSGRQGSKMIRKLVLLLALVCLVAGYSEIRYLELDGANLIDTSPTNFAITAPLLLQNNWKTLSVNGDNVIAIKPSCEAVVRNLNSLSNEEKTLIQTAKNQIQSVDNNNGGSVIVNNSGQMRRGSMRFALDGSQMQSSGVNMQISNLNYNGFSISKYGDNDHFSLSKPGLPNNLARIFLNGDVLTYVYLGGQVRSQPVSCLQPAERQLLDQLRIEVSQAEAQFKESMHQFGQQMQQNMHNMQMNMQNMRQNMQQNMNNMFGNGFPFNRASAYVQPNQPSMYPAQYQQQSLYSPFPYNQAVTNPFGSNFPFGPNNNPFAVPGFPFNG